MTITIADKVREGRLLNILSQICGALAAVTGLVAILGWITENLLLAGFGSPVPMAPSTALLFIFYGSAVFLSIRNPQSRMVYLSGMSVGLTGTLVATLLLFLSYLGIHLNIEHLGIPISGTAGGVPIGYISPLTAVCFVLVGISFIATLLSTPDSSGRAIAAFWLACFIILTSFVLLSAYLFGTPLLYGGHFIPPALSTSLAFIALGISLLLFAGNRSWPKSAMVEGVDKRTARILILVFLVLAVGIISAGYFYYHSYEKQYRAEVEHQLSAVAEMKVDELVDWREERLQSAAIIYKNPAFSDLVMRYFGNPQDTETQKRLHAWLNKYPTEYQYNQVRLLDAQGVTRISLPAGRTPVSSAISKRTPEILRSRQVTVVDFYRNEHDQRIYLTILVPILDEHDGNRAIGLLALRIDPQKYLYPYINRWPTPNRTAETLIVRREGNEVVFLNELKFQKNAALNLRIPVEITETPAVKAVLGQQGIVEGRDYRGVPVIAYVRSVPNSPWFLVARMDISEVYTPLRERLWEIVILIGALLICAGAGTGFVWRHQRTRFYREKYEAAEALRESEEQFRAMFDVASIGIAQADIRTGKWLRVNQKMCEITGYSAEEMLQMRIPEITHPEDRQRDWEAFQRVVRGETPDYRLEKRYVRKDGSQVWVNVNMTVIRDADGQPMRTMATIEDITERKRAAKALTESEERYRALIENAHDMIQSVAQDGHFHFVNSAWLKIMGYTLDELQKITLFDILHQRCIPHCMEAFKKVMSGESLNNMEAIFVSKDGRSIDVQGNVAPRFIDGELVGSQGIFRDITEQKRADEAIRKSEEKYRSIFENIQDVYYETTLDGTILEVSPSIHKVSGGQYQRDYLIGKSMLDFYTTPNLRDTLLTNLQKHGSVSDMEITFRNRDGSLIPCSISAVLQYDDDGKPTKLIGSLHDITERKRSEEEIRKLNAELEQRVLDRTAQLEAANKELEAFSYSVSHDLRAPVRHIAGFVEILMEDAAQALDEESRRYLNIISDSTKHMGQLIDDILSFSRMGRTEMKKTPVNPDQLVKEAVNELQPEMTGRDIVWEFHPLPEVYGDPSMLKLVWVNLIGNALKYTRAQVQAKIEIGYNEEENDYIFYVRDNGAGFDMTYGHKLFNIFQRLHRAEEFEGTGVGLANVRRIIQRHGGRTWAEGKINEGATFYFSLPKAKKREE